MKNYYKTTRRQWPLHGLGKKASLLLLLFSLLQYPYEAHSTICSDVLNGGSNKLSKGEFDYNEKKRKELLDESLEHEHPSIVDFFKSHDTVIFDSDNGRLLIASVRPSTNPTPDQRLKAKIQLAGATAAKNFSLRRSDHLSLPLEFYTRMTKILILYMSRYLKENGVSHTVFHYIPHEKPRHTDNVPNIKIQINPSRSTPLGKLATDFYERYNGGHLVYNPYFLMSLYSQATYIPHESAIILPESFFLNMNLKNLTLLHELRHAKIYRDIEYTPDSPYHILLSGKSLLEEPAYKEEIHFSEMITYQQDSRIHLRHIASLGNESEANDTLTNLTFSLETGLKLNKEIEEKLSLALTFFNQTPEYFIRQSPVDLSTQTQFFQIKTPYYNITFRPESNQTYTLLEIFFLAERFSLRIPYHNRVINRANDKALQKAIKERLQLALKASIFHRKRYSIALAVVRKAEKTTDMEERTLLLRALQSSQILAQKFDPNRPEESLEELSDKLKSDFP